MRYTKQILALIFAILIFAGVGVSTASAQRGRAYHGSVVRFSYIHRPFWGFDRWNYDPFYDPYFYDPYLSERRTRYYKERDVRNKRKDLAKDREKYYADGYLSPKEQEKLAKAERKYNNAVEDLNDYNRDR